MPGRLYNDWESQLRQWHIRTPLSPPVSCRLEYIFEEQVNQHQHQIAVEDCSTNLNLTYGQLNRAANGLALRLMQVIKANHSRHMHHSHGTHFILLFVDASLHVPVSFLGILKAGFVIVPIDTSAPVDRIRFILKDASVCLILTQSKYMDLFARNMAIGTIPNICVLDLEKKVDLNFAEVDLPNRNPEGLEPAYCIYTSGTTGHPVSFFKGYQ